MSDYRRYFVPGGTFFFTVVTCQRRQIFFNEIARGMLRKSIGDVRRNRPFQIVAICLLPDHLHAIWTLPNGDCDYSMRWRRIKESFTKRWLAAGGSECRISASRQSKQERGVWQRRFWEHTIRDEDDLERCTDYIHWNPRKHNLVPRVRDWKWSSFFRFVEAGNYEIDWGGRDPCFGWDAPDRWGE